MRTYTNIIIKFKHKAKNSLFHSVLRIELNDTRSSLIELT